MLDREQDKAILESILSTKEGGSLALRTPATSPADAAVQQKAQAYAAAKADEAWATIVSTPGFNAAEINYNLINSVTNKFFGDEETQKMLNDPEFALYVNLIKDTFYYELVNKLQ